MGVFCEIFLCGLAIILILFVFACVIGVICVICVICDSPKHFHKRNRFMTCAH